MAIALNQASVAPEPLQGGETRQRLLTGDRVRGTRVLLDRLTLPAGAKKNFVVSEKSLAWFQVLSGEAMFAAYYHDRLSEVHSVFLSPGFKGTLSTDKGVSLLYAEVPDLAALDPGFLNHPPHFMVMDW